LSVAWKLAARPLFFAYWFGQDPTKLAPDEIASLIDGDWQRLFIMLGRDLFHETVEVTKA